MQNSKKFGFLLFFCEKVFNFITEVTNPQGIMAVIEKPSNKENEIDFFATFYNGKCYLVPQNECSTQKSLRILPPKNGQTKGVSFLKDYEAKEVLQAL